MNFAARSAVSEECHRILTELRKYSQKSLYPEAQSQLSTIKLSIWDSDLDNTTIIGPFLALILHQLTTDSLVYHSLCSIRSLLIVLPNLNESTIDEIVKCICSCSFQSTSEFESSRVTHLLLCCIQVLCGDRLKQQLTYFAKQTMLGFMIQETSQLKGIVSVPLVLIDTFNELAKVLFSNSNDKDLQKECIVSLFYICSSFQRSYDVVACFTSLNVLLFISKLDYKDNKCVLVGCSCVILNQQINNCLSKDNLILSLRLFFNVFSLEWNEYAIPFGKCFHTVLEFITNPSTISLFITSALEIVADFVYQPSFSLYCFSKTYNQNMFPQVFEKLIDSLVILASSPSNSEYQQLAIRIIVKILDQISNHPICDEQLLRNPDESYEKSISELLLFSDKFNSSIKSFSNEGEFNAEQLALLMFTAPKVASSSVGEFFARNTLFSSSTLSSYCNLFDFSGLDFDMSIRVFLSSFQIAGEGQIVDRILDSFAKRFYLSHSDKGFSNAESVHVLSYAWMMLHTSLYNSNVTKKQCLEDFLSMLKGQNGGTDFSMDMLSTLFHSLKRFSVPIDEDHKLNSIAYWVLMMQKQNRMSQDFFSKDLTISKNQIKCMFNHVWSVSQPIFTNIINFNILDETLSKPAFLFASKISSQIDDHEILDTILKQFSSIAQIDLSTTKSIEALNISSCIVRNFGNTIRNSWRSYADLFLYLFQLDSLSEEICSLTNIYEKNKSFILSPRMLQKSKQKESSSILSVFGLRSKPKNIVENLDSGYEKIKQSVKTSQIQEFPKQSIEYSIDSISFIFSAFIDLSGSMEYNIESNCIYIAFCLHMICIIASTNSSRLSMVWKKVMDYFLRLFENQYSSSQSQFFYSLVFSSYFSLIDEIWCDIKMHPYIKSSFGTLAEIDKQFINENYNSVITGLDFFFEHHFDSFCNEKDFKLLLSLVNIGSNDQQFSRFGSHFHNIVLNNQNEWPSNCIFDDFWIPLIQTAINLCMNESEEKTIEKFGDLQTILTSTPLSQLDSSLWKDIFFQQLFPIITPQRKSKIGYVRSLQILKTTMNVFISLLPTLNTMSVLKSIWFKILSASIELAKCGDHDIMEAIPELLRNALRIMQVWGVFDRENSHDLIELTQKEIQSFYPQIMFKITQDTI